jgi:hypothetical protein
VNKGKVRLVHSLAFRHSTVTLYLGQSMTIHLCQTYFAVHYLVDADDFLSMSTEPQAVRKLFCRTLACQRIKTGLHYQTKLFNNPMHKRSNEISAFRIAFIDPMSRYREKRRFVGVGTAVDRLCWLDVGPRNNGTAQAVLRTGGARTGLLGPAIRWPAHTTRRLVKDLIYRQLAPFAYCMTVTVRRVT